MPGITQALNEAASTKRNNSSRREGKGERRRRKESCGGFERVSDTARGKNGHFGHFGAELFHFSVQNRHSSARVPTIAASEITKPPLPTAMTGKPTLRHRQPDTNNRDNGHSTSKARFTYTPRQRSMHRPENHYTPPNKITTRAPSQI